MYYSRIQANQPFLSHIHVNLSAFKCFYATNLLKNFEMQTIIPIFAANKMYFLKN